MNPSPNKNPTKSSQDSLQSISSLSTEQLIYQLYSIINDQEVKINQFQTLLNIHVQNLRNLQQKYQTQKEYATSLFNKIEQLKKQNRQNKIQIDLLRSDNLILKSKLSYRQQKQHRKSNKQRGQDASQDKRSQNSQDLDARSSSYSAKSKNTNEYIRYMESKYKQLQAKFISMRKPMKKLLKFMQKVILNNEEEQQEMIQQITELMKYIK